MPQTVLYPAPVPPRAIQISASVLPGMIPNEAELTAGVRVTPGRAYGFFTDTSLCIGCKSCEVACKEWNLLPADDMSLSGMSYDNSRALSATTWRHVNFIELPGRLNGGAAISSPGIKQTAQGRWMMMSDVCKHCQQAGCLEACPTGALFRTEFNTVVVQQDVCNGCGYCVPSCPFGVIALNENDGKAHKCTLCYDRLKGGLEPACAKACPTNSIQFGPVEELFERAHQRLVDLHTREVSQAYLYGIPGGPGATGGIEHLNAFFLLLARPEQYNLPAAPQLPQRRVSAGLRNGLLTMIMLGMAAALAFFIGER